VNRSTTGAKGIRSCYEYLRFEREYENAGNGWLRAAFGSIIRRHSDEIVNLSPDERKKLIKAIGAPETYTTELSKELKGMEYDRRHKHNKR
jgi:hypothetical protein